MKSVLQNVALEGVKESQKIEKTANLCLIERKLLRFEYISITAFSECICT